MTARTIITTAGLSIFQGKSGLQSRGLEWDAGPAAQQRLRDLADQLGPPAAELSAELAVLRKLEVTADDAVVFLATDTDRSEQAGIANGVVAQRLFGIDSDALDVSRISGLVLHDASLFRSTGIPNLVARLDTILHRAAEAGRQPFISISGGIKPIVPYVTLYGMMRAVPIVYIFEDTGALVKLPPLPIDFDWEALESAAQVAREIETKGCIETRILHERLGHELGQLGGLFEVDQDAATLSAFGLLLMDGLRRAAESPVLLSPRARQVLDNLHGNVRDYIDGMLSKIRNPIARDLKRHAFHGTDLAVYKPGNTGPRLAYWVNGDTVFVAEIYPDHNEYERDLPGRHRAHYDPATFAPWWAPAGDIQEDLSGDEVVAAAALAAERARRQAARADEERETALALATEMEQRLADKESELAAVRETAALLQARMEALEAQQRQTASWGLLRRLLWAFSGRLPGNEKVASKAAPASAECGHASKAGGPSTSPESDPMPRYRYGLLDPRPGADNDWAFTGGPTLGIEVTVPELASRCSEGNIDPQHSGGDPSRAAIEAAMECSLPRAGALLLTIRPDLDSLGSMALFELRARDNVSDGVRERVRKVAEADAWQRGPWPGRQPLDELLEVGELEPIGAIVMDAQLSLEERVRRMAEWLATGTCAGWDRAAQQLAEEKRTALETTQISSAANGRIAVVRSTYRNAVALGYRQAPVVVAENPVFRFQGGAPHRKVTIAQYEPGWVDLQRVVSVLSEREPGWGGSPTICGSPQGTACALPTEEIVSVVQQHLTARQP